MLTAAVAWVAGHKLAVLSLAVVLWFVAGVLTIAACMMSSQHSRTEERLRRLLAADATLDKLPDSPAARNAAALEAAQREGWSQWG